MQLISAFEWQITFAIISRVGFFLFFSIFFFMNESCAWGSRAVLSACYLHPEDSEGTDWYTKIQYPLTHFYVAQHIGVIFDYYLIKEVLIFLLILLNI